MNGPSILVPCENHRDDKMTECHSNRPSQHDRLSAKLVDVKHGRNGGKEHSYANDASCKQACGVAGESECLENGWRIVED